MTNTPHRPKNNLGEVSHRYDIARELIEIWRCIESALSDVPELVDEISRLRTQLQDARLNRANLAAAARASIAAHDEGEADPLSYLRDELRAQGFKPSGGAADAS